jgi:transcriptional regulator with XRE-family HTH domain
MKSGGRPEPPSRLRLWRTEQGWSLDDLSGLTGLSTAMLSLVERRKREMAPATKVRVARRLGVRVSDLFEVEPAEVET